MKIECCGELVDKPETLCLCLSDSLILINCFFVDHKCIAASDAQVSLFPVPVFVRRHGCIHMYTVLYRYPFVTFLDEFTNEFHINQFCINKASVAVFVNCVINKNIYILVKHFVE